MLYKIPTDEEIVDIWIPAFTIISIEPFPYLYTDLGFGVSPNQVLIQICREFLSAFQVYIRKPLPTPPFPQSNFTTVSEDFLQAAWEVAMTKLHDYNFVTHVYSWATRTISFYQAFNNKFSDEHHWAALLEDWLIKHPDHSAWSDIPLPKSSIELLRLVVWGYSQQLKHVQEKIDRAEKVFSGIWLEYFDVLGWYFTLSRFLLALEKWQNIIRFVPEEDIVKLQNWGWEHLENIGIQTTRNKFPVHLILLGRT